jgi:3-methylcrotonyl-CoA carboxylase alpha subunit
MFRKVLIANRGEIAVRIARTCHALGIRVVAVYSDADRTALHVRTADEAYRVGPPPALESYLNIEAIIAAARASGAEAIHPGYGFLSENAAFAERVAEAGIVFIGPPPAAIRAMGDKAAAKRLMAAAGVPVVPGYDGDEQSDERLCAEAERIGYPLLIKAAAGGGGRGMREVARPEEFAEELASARREARAAFGDDRVLLERLITGGRHVEVQIFGDAHGEAIYLGERDCSTQRRHQKVIEEAPSPAVDAELRRRIGEAAVRAARSVGYTNAGTVEFLLAADGSFYFLEMNTRLQVEHPVTELITGLDLVRLQLEIATGRPLPLRQEEVELHGHAIEARLYAEDPFRDYLPSSGRLARFRMPEGEDVRVDTGYDEGATVSPYYDAMLAKIIVAGTDRAEAVQRLRAALSVADVEGVPTNLPLLRAVADSAAFVAGEVTTDFLERFWTPGAAAALPPEEAVLAAAAALIAGGPPAQDGAPDPWHGLGAWRLGSAPRRVAFALDGHRCVVEARPLPARDEWALCWNGSERAVRIERPSGMDVLVWNGAEVIGAGWRDGMFMARGTPYALRPLPLPSPDNTAAASAAGDENVLVAPMPGLLIKVNVREGDVVRANQTVAVLEAMKMEHAIQSSRDGRVRKVHYQAGERVTGGAVLVEIEPLTGAA